MSRDHTAPASNAPKTRGPVSVIWLSVGAALLTIALKAIAWLFTDSVGLLSDALESLVNLAGAVFALRMLTLARTPPDAQHPFGHGKAEYFSSGFEGLLILVAAGAIGVAAVSRLIAPKPLASLDIGLVLSVIASAINFAVARVLFKASRRYRSAALEADARHLMTDVWTTGGLVVGLGLVMAFDAPWIDPILAILVAANIAREAIHIIRETASGLLDSALDPARLATVAEVLRGFETDGVEIVRTQSRQAGHQAFALVTLHVPGAWTVARAHALSDAIEAALADAVPGLVGVVHVEPAGTVDTPRN